MYEAALAFKAVEPWRWMYDSDMFGVQNPVDGEIGYCSALGNLGEVFALVVYPGTEGLESCNEFAAGELDGDGDEAIAILNCLMVAFEDRGELEKRDLEVIRDLGHKFRGRKEWPIFRSYRPGYAPWYLTGDEVRFMTLALQQATEVCLRCEENKGILMAPQEDQLLVRLADKDGEGYAWRDEWLAPEYPDEGEDSLEPLIDELRVERARRAVTRKEGIWETDFFPTPIYIQEGERPYYPRMFLWVDRSAGLILEFYLAPPSEGLTGFAESLLSAIEKSGSMPREIQVKRGEALALLSPLASLLGIRLSLRERLSLLEQAQQSLLERFV
ncbi:MAG: hypothetical protein HW403_92 [Dehalococcoidia bacterium]|nr:hypothetical protein [Dehalococcoidia bacterium]